MSVKIEVKMENNLFLTIFCVLIFSLQNGIANQDISSISDDQSHPSRSKQMLLDRASGKSYQFGTIGPCGKNMIFYHHPVRDGYGFCDCDQGVNSKYPCSDHPVRRMIYISSRKQCFPIFSKGPCNDGFWLNLTKDARPKCEPNLCLEEGASAFSNDPIHQFWFYDTRRNSCYQTQSRGYCPVGLTLEVTHDSVIPKCKKKICYSKLTNFRSFLTCKPGSRYSYLLKGCIVKPQRVHYYVGIG